MAGTLEKQCRRHVQIDNPTRVMQAGTIFRIQNHAPASRQHNIRLGSQLRYCLRFATTKALFAFDLEDHRYRHPGSLDNFMVGIVERAPESFCQLAANCSFAGTHQSDEIDIATIIHAGILSDSEHSPKERAGIAGPLTFQFSINQLICNLSERIRGVMKNSNSRRCPVSF